MRRASSLLAVLVGVAGLAGCGGDGGNMMGPNATGMGPTSGALMSVTPQGGSAGVSTSAPIVFRFAAAMTSGMEQYVDLHRGDLAGAEVPMRCAWSGDRTTLTCTPQAALSARTTYVVHLGGGMMTQSGQPLDYAQYGPMIGGQWIMGGMMGGSHGGSPWGMMGSSWRNTNGSYGMAFTFTTA